MIADKLTQISENTPKVYQAGKDKEWSDFWDNLQISNDGVLGGKTNYSYHFRTKGWNQYNFKPKYDLIMTASNIQTFEFFNQYGAEFDFAGHLEDIGITIDTSGCTSLQNTFYMMFVTRMPEINASNATVMTGMLNWNHSVTVDKIILKADGSQTLNNTFSNMMNLKNIVIEGVIGQDGVNLSASVLLSKASITSFINALSGTASEKSITFSLAAVNKAFETAEGAGDGSESDEWTALIAEKSNWTISLA